MFFQEGMMKIWMRMLTCLKARPMPQDYKMELRNIIMGWGGNDNSLKNENLNDIL
jgi:hypothetical protein